MGKIGKEGMPKVISSNILQLCNGIVAGGTPVYVHNYPDIAYESWNSFKNVESMVSKHGGKQINGWCIMQWANMMISAYPYAVWKNANGQLFNITHQEEGVNRILFQEDSQVIYRGKYLQGNIKPLTDSKLVSELIDMANEIDDILSGYPPDEVDILEVGPKMKRLNNKLKSILDNINKTVYSNNKCPCGSGLKFKKCCGR